MNSYLYVCIYEYTCFPINLRLYTAVYNKSCSIYTMCLVISRISEILIILRCHLNLGVSEKSLLFSAGTDD